MNGAWLFWLTRQRLRPGQVWLFFGAAMMLHSIPLLMNNYAYIDDNARGLLALTWWREEGRAFGDWLMHGLSMTTAAPEVFPLTLFGGMLAMAWAMCTLARRWFGNPTPMQCATLLPLWYNPFYLQVLSYHYDCFTVSVGIALMAQAVAWRHSSRLLQWGVPCVLVAASLSTNQLTLNVFLGLACVDLLVRALRQPVAARLWALALRHLFTVAAGCIAYALTGYQTLTRDRGGLVLGSFADWELRAQLIAQRLGLFLNPVAAVAFALVVLGALLGLAIILRRGWKRPQRVLFVALCTLAVLGAFLSVGGLLFFVNDPYNALGARALMGASPWLVGLAWLAYVGWVTLHRALVLLLLPSLWCCLAFAYAYGQVMHDKQSLEQFTRTVLGMDLLAQPAVQASREIVILRDGNGPLFTPNCVAQAWPAMDYIFGNHYLMLPEQLTPWGFGTVRLRYRYSVPALGEPLLVRPWYRIYVQDGVSYVRFTVKAAPVECRVQ
ncbi:MULTISPECIES: glucosyltransferase domain-containing protein [unclassified Pseudomonas]|uniref:glucosyltransferase domain-containing protein n=1 Tax=unclassified Pseudomonas TaxID=196821 RepID=UPI000BD14505|nr:MULTISPECIES: glucosyltransferase domain-containing protein [unclassified Pseudomonas]PVZ11352.1 glucosyltransferase GtrII-like protein [Pseudomonas sp. URIL14HWK12:I12]PVZ22350.1 glucosyltransferase GtrII-like protein [Pseudomonas sp. URIL14HWK12:I10]PVZ31526.1 glucosyltransferase GtrII-like protein [Pseudomonas sp. URIL14HWK12:I11]SNZ16500.1 Glucosyl transferase GtrII [Pseudomonas sp. URIL14HWK12:I9]